MLLISAVLLILVAAMHSLLGGKHLIAPLLQQDNFPIILGSVERSRLTLWVGWHMLSVTWLVLAGLLLVMHVHPAERSALLFGVCGLTALVLSRGRHLSWVLFLPVCVLLSIEAMR